jgi:hypothetical protein
MGKVVIIILAVLGGLAALALLSLVCAIPVWLLWNWLCPGLFGLPTIGLWQAWGLNILCGCLFKTVGIGGGRK